MRVRFCLILMNTRTRLISHELGTSPITLSVRKLFIRKQSSTAKKVSKIQYWISETVRKFNKLIRV